LAATTIQRQNVESPISAIHNLAHKLERKGDDDDDDNTRIALHFPRQSQRDHASVAIVYIPDSPFAMENFSKEPLPSAAK
jgi:hypothetical protein